MNVAVCRSKYVILRFGSVDRLTGRGQKDESQLVIKGQVRETGWTHFRSR